MRIPPALLQMGVLVPSFSGAFWGVSCQGRACHEGTVVMCSGCPHPPAPARLPSAFPRTAGGLTIPVWKAPFPLGVFLWSSSCLQRPVASQCGYTVFVIVGAQTCLFPATSPMRARTVLSPAVCHHRARSSHTVGALYAHLSGAAPMCPVCPLQSFLWEGERVPGSGVLEPSVLPARPIAAREPQLGGPGRTADLVVLPSGGPLGRSQGPLL